MTLYAKWPLDPVHKKQSFPVREIFAGQELSELLLLGGPRCGS